MEQRKDGMTSCWQETCKESFEERMVLYRLLGQYYSSQDAVKD